MYVHFIYYSIIYDGVLSTSIHIYFFHLLGAPVKGEVVPIRLHLSSINLSPTYKTVNNVFSVKYYINLVLVDEEDRRYFKQQEILFWRCSEDTGVRTPGSGGGGGNIRNSFLPSTFRLKDEEKKVASAHTNEKVGDQNKA
jgi:hypothetical protein